MSFYKRLHIIATYAMLYFKLVFKLKYILVEYMPVARKCFYCGKVMIMSTYQMFHHVEKVCKKSNRCPSPQKIECQSNLNAIQKVKPVPIPPKI